MVIKNCQKCNREYSVKAYRANESKYCSFECYTKTRPIDYKICKKCGGRKYGHKSIVCRSCFKIPVKPRPRKNKERKEGLKRVCEKCHEIFFIESWQEGKFCSRECQNKYYSSSNSKLFKHGKSKTKDYCNMRGHRYRAKKKSNGGDYTLKEWQKLKKIFKYTCPFCFRKEPGIKLTVDHILPISLGGTNYITNIQPLCHSCNSGKRDRAIKINPKGQQEFIFEEIAWQKLVQEVDQIILEH